MKCGTVFRKDESAIAMLNVPDSRTIVPRHRDQRAWVLGKHEVTNRCRMTRKRYRFNGGAGPDADFAVPASLSEQLPVRSEGNYRERFFARGAC